MNREDPDRKGGAHGGQRDASSPLAGLGEAERRAAIRLHDDYAHGALSRRALMAGMARIGGSMAAAALLVEAIAADPAQAALTSPDDARLETRRGPIGFASALSGYVAARKGGGRRGVLLVIHENRGLNAHIEDVARRFALAGFFAVAPDMLSPAGGTPADEDAARKAIGALDLEAAVGAAAALGSAMKDGLRHSSRKLGVVGFCWGGAFVNRLAVAMGERLDAGVSYYGPAPDPAEAGRVKAALMLHYAGLDERVAKTGEPWAAALEAAGAQVAVHRYPGVDHAFNNDTSAARFDPAAATLAWQRSVDFLRRHL